MPQNTHQQLSLNNRGRRPSLVNKSNAPDLSRRRPSIVTPDTKFDKNERKNSLIPEDGARSDCESVLSVNSAKSNRSIKSNRSARSRRSSIDSQAEKKSVDRRKGSIGGKGQRKKKQKDGGGVETDGRISEENLLSNTPSVQGDAKIELLMPSATNAGITRRGSTSSTTSNRLRPSSAANSDLDSDSGSSRSSAASGRPKSSTRRRKSSPKGKGKKVKNRPKYLFEATQKHTWIPIWQSDATWVKIIFKMHPIPTRASTQLDKLQTHPSLFSCLFSLVFWWSLHCKSLV